MDNWLSKIAKTFNRGDRVEQQETVGQFHSLIGTVVFVYKGGDVEVKWDNGYGQGIYPFMALRPATKTSNIGDPIETSGAMDKETDLSGGGGTGTPPKPYNQDTPLEAEVIPDTAPQTNLPANAVVKSSKDAELGGESNPFE